MTVINISSLDAADLDVLDFIAFADFSMELTCTSETFVNFLPLDLSGGDLEGDLGVWYTGSDVIRFLNCGFADCPVRPFLC